MIVTSNMCERGKMPSTPKHTHTQREIFPLTDQDYFEDMHSQRV